MAVGIDMFGAGGEALSGLFMGNQIAQQRDAAAMEQQKALADIANTQAITRQRQLGNELEGAILGDRIQQFKDAATAKREDAQIEKYGRQGEQFGRMSEELKAMPAAARQSRLRQIAQQQGIGEDNPMLQQFMSIDPEQLPDVMGKYAQGFYEQSDKARAEKQKRDAMLEQAREGFRAKAEEGEANRQMRRDIAGETNQLRRDIAAMTQAGANQRAAISAAARGAAGGRAPTALSTDKAIAKLIMEDPNLETAQKLEALQRYNLSKPVVGKPDTSSITGLPSAQERVEAAVRGSKPAGSTAPAPQTKAAPTGGGDIAAAVKNTGQPYEPDKYEYRVSPDGRVLRKPKSQAVPK